GIRDKLVTGVQTCALPILWHGVSHLDDARQAPPNTNHFDGAWLGPNTDSPFQPGQHIPGLNVGGWYDAGDYDIRAETQYAVIQEIGRASCREREEIGADDR